MFFLMAIFGTAVMSRIYLLDSKCFECSQSGENVLKNSLIMSTTKKINVLYEEGQF